MGLGVKLTVSAAAAFMVACAVVEFQHKNKVDPGAEYLREKGYTEVTGGERVLFSTCWRGAVARSYQAKNVHGEPVTKIVCRGLFSTYAPVFDSHDQPLTPKP